MLKVHRELINHFKTILQKKGIPIHHHSHYRKWLLYYAETGFSCSIALLFNGEVSFFCTIFFSGARVLNRSGRFEVVVWVGGYYAGRRRWQIPRGPSIER